MTFKTWLSDLTKIQNVINNISKIDLFVNDSNLLNANTVKALSSSINGLNIQQAQLALSTKKLTNEQMNQVLIESGLIASENKIQAELLQTTLAQTALSKEKQNAILIDLGLMKADTLELFSTKSCTKAKLEDILATKGITGANAEAIISTLGLSTANTTATFSFELLAASIWKSITALWTFLTTTPLGWFTMIAGGIGIVVGGISLLTTSMEEASEATIDAISELSSIISEIETLEGKIADLKSQIDGLNPITDEEDIRRLEAETLELENQLAILKEKERLAKEDTDEKARESLGKTQTSRYEVIEGQSQVVNGYIQETGGAYAEVTREEELKNAMNAYDEYYKQRLALEEELVGMSATDEGYAEKQKAVDVLNQQMKDARTHASELALALDEEKDGLSGTTAESKALLDSTNATLSTYSQWLNGINGTTNALNNNANAIDNATASATKFTKTQMIDTINSMADGFDVLDDIYADVLDGGTFDFTKLDTSKFSEAFSEITPEYEKFIETVSASPTDIDACQGAFNDLVSAFIDSKGVLEGVDEETKQLTIDMLENMGVVNAEEVVMSALGLSFEDYANAKRECASAGVNLITATDTEIERLINMKLVSEETAQSLFYYQLQKALSNENCLDTSADCANLIMLAQNAGVTGGVLEDLIELEQIQKQLESGGIISEHMLSKLMARAEELNASIKSQSTQFQTTVKPISQYTGAGKTADAMNKKLKDSTDAVTEAMKKEKEALERTKSKLEKQKQYYEDVAEAIDWFYDKQIDKQQKAIDKLEKENELLEERIDYYDGALSAIDRYYEKQIEKLEEEKNALAGNNKEVETAINLEKKQQELLEARSKKTLGLYQKGKGVTYVTDASAIKTAEENLAEAQRQKEEADIDAKIEKLKEYQALWAEIPNIKQNAEEQSQMISLLGVEWESILLEGRIANFTSFKDQYISLQQQVDNNESMIKSYEEKIAYYESLKLEWDNLLAKYQEDTYTQLLIGAFGNDFENELLNGRTGRWVQFAEDYYNIQVELKDVTDQIEALTARMEEYASRIESAANDAVAAVKKLKEAEAEANSSKGWYTGGWTSAIKPSGKAKGGIITKEDEGDLDFVAKSLGEDHMVALTEGEAVIPKENVAKNPEVVQSLIDGDDVSNNLTVDDLAQKYGIILDYTDISISEWGKYSAVREGVEIKRPEWTIADGMKNFSLSDALYNIPNDVVASLNRIQPIVNNNQQKSITVSFGDIHVHGVQNADAFAREIETKMSRKVTQALSKNSL